jgi:hypothetical protein
VTARLAVAVELFTESAILTAKPFDLLEELALLLIHRSLHRLGIAEFAAAGRDYSGSRTAAAPYPVNEDEPIVDSKRVMPYLRCTEEECGARFYEASRFADQCPECGAAAVVIDLDDEPRHDDRLGVPGRPGQAEHAHPAHARVMARRVLAEHKITAPPVPVRALARLVGIEIVEVESLGSLSARLIDDRIELVAGEPEVRKRFSIAHELGHHFLHTVHGSSTTSEREADAFAGELLVPGHFLRTVIAKTASVDELRRRFQVSRQVIEIAADTHKLRDRVS